MLRGWLFFLAALLPCTAQVPFAGTVIGAAGGAGQILYASTGTGFFKSIDAGANWTPFYLAEAGHLQPPLVAFTVDPQTEANLYLATNVASGSVWRSTDAGATWSVANTGLPSTGAVSVSKLVLIPANGNLYARIGASLYKSQDRATTWRQQGASLPSASGSLDINLTNPSIMVLGGGDRIWKSTNEGATWSQTATLQTFQDQNTTVNTVISDPTASRTVYAAVAGSLFRVGNQNVTGVHISTDEAQTFRPPPPLPALSSQPIRLLIDPSGGPNVYAPQSSGGYCVSRNRGGDWTCPPDSILGPGLNPTSSRLTFIDPKNASLLYGGGTRAGAGVMFRSRNAAVSWEEMTAKARPTLSRAQPIAVVLAQGAETVVRLNVASIDLPTAVLPFTATTSGESWVSLGAVSGNMPFNLNVNIRAGGLKPGSYDATIAIASPQTANESVSIPVQLTVPSPVSSPRPAYTISTFAGNGEADYSGDGGPAAAAGIGTPAAIAVDRDGNVFFASSAHHRIRRVNRDGRIETVAGTGVMGSSGDAGPATQALLTRPNAIAVDRAGVLYLLENSRLLRRITGGTIASALPPTTLLAPNALTMDQLDRLWIQDIGRFQRYTPPASVTTLATPGATFIGVTDIAFDTAGNMYVADSSHRVQRVTPAGVVTPFAGTGVAGTGSDGVPATATQLNRPSGLAVDAAGNVLIAEAGAHRIRIVTPAGLIYTIAGNGESGFDGDGGSAKSGRLQSPDDLAVAADGSIYVTVTGRIRKLTRVETPAPNITLGPRNIASGFDQVSPGTAFFVEGENLAIAEESVSAPPWAPELAGASLSIKGIPVPLSAAGPGRLTGQVPWDLPPGEATLVATVNDVSGPAVTFEVLPASPGIFTLEDGRANAVNPDGSANSADSPAPSTSEMAVYVTGVGPFDPPVPSGAGALEDPVSHAVLPFTVTVGESTAEPLGIELVPGMVGVAKARFRLPEGLAAGDHPVVITVEGRASNGARISVGGQ